MVTVGHQPATVDAARTAGARVGPAERFDAPLDIAQRRVGEAQHVMAERGWLRVLQVGLVRHQRVAVPGGKRAMLTTSSALASIKSLMRSRKWSRNDMRTASRRGRPT